MSNGTDLLNVLFRWAHIGSAIVLVGGSVFIAFLLAPAAGRLLTGDQYESLKSEIHRRWKTIVHVTIALLLLSGLYAMFVRGREMVALWNALAGVKLLLGLYVMFVASALVGRSQGLEAMRQQAPKWLKINVLVAAIIVMIAGVMRFLPTKEQAANAPQADRAAVKSPEAP